MPMHPLVSSLRNAYESRSNDSFYPALDRVQAALIAAATPDLATLDRHQLEGRRNALHVKLAAVNDQLQQRGFTRNADLAADRMETIALGGGTLSLEPSDPSA